LLEGPETLTLTLDPGDGYLLDPVNSATILLQDAFVAGFPGVIDPDDTQLEDQITYLEAAIVNGELVVDVGLETPFLDNVTLFLDTDQNPFTGDYRPGYQGGAEYRISGFAGILNDFALIQLPTTLGEAEQQIAMGPATLSGDVYTVRIPLNWIGNPTGVDVVAKVQLNNPSQVAGDGDRAPNFGALDTQSGQVVVRQPVPTRSVTVTDPFGDSRNDLGFDITALQVSTLADQFFMTLAFSEAFDLTQLSSAGPAGRIVIDGDRSLETGGIFMGNHIPTWGGDVEINFDLSIPLTPQFLLFFDPSGAFTLFDGDISDGRWLTQGNRLEIAGALSLLDAFQFKGGRGVLLEDIVRVPVQGDLVVQAETFTLGELAPVDTSPNGGQALDTAAQAIAVPYAWDPAQTIVRTDPEEFGGVPDTDLIQVDAQTIDDALVVKGTLSSWLSTSAGIFYEVLLDTDMNTATGELVQDSLAPEQPGIGADYTLQIAAIAAPGSPTYYEASLWQFPGEVSPHEALLLPQPRGLGQPGSFTVTIPLALMGNPTPEVRFWVSTGQFVPSPSFDRFDFAPPEPIVINVQPNLGNLVGIACEASPDHGLLGQTTLSFTIVNQGAADVAGFDVAMVYSDDDQIGNADDLIVGTVSFPGLGAGQQLTHSEMMQLPQDILNSRAQADDPPGLGSNYVSGSTDVVGIVIDPDGLVSETQAGDNFNQGQGIDKDDITYFPWDVDGSGQVTPSDAIYVINRLGQTTTPENALADFDGNGQITPSDAIAAINRLGYRINPQVIETLV
jgi:hypothetical protein